MKILVCGMPRSMTTWAFNAIRELVGAPDARPLWIEPASPEEDDFARSAGIVIAKCHHFSPTLAKAADIVVYSYRDLRTAAVSAYRKFGATGSREQLETWIAVERLWLPRADLVIRYEDVEADPLAGLRQIAELLAARGVVIPGESSEAILSRIDAAFSRRENASGPGFDAQTLILAGHRTFQPAVDLLPTRERAMYMRVQEEFAAWLQSHGYMDGAQAPPSPRAEGDPLEAYLRALMREAAAKEGEMRVAAEAGAASEAARERADSALQAAIADLRAKQGVIDEMTRTLRAYRAAFGILGFILVPLNRALSRGRALFYRLSAGFRPKLGILHQHAPKALCVPAATVAPPDPAPRISIVTPSFRQAVFIERTIRSVLDQEYPNLEYFVQDGRSGDGTVEILERYASRLTGWMSEPDTGQSQAINRAFSRTTGEIMAWLNSDDILFPGALAQVADFFARHPDVDVIYGHRVLIDEEDREIGRWLMPAHDGDVLSWADFIPQETLFWRRSIWERAGGRVDESFRFAMDWDLLLRFREAGAQFARVPLFLGAFRVHAQQKTTAGISDVGFGEMDRLRERTLGRVPSRREITRAVVPYMMRHTAAHLGWRLRIRLGLQP